MGLSTEVLQARGGPTEFDLVVLVGNVMLFVADAAAAGLRVAHRFGTYELHPPDDQYAVWVLARDDS